MIIDARQIDQNANIPADVCIVGAGAAGITLALELAGTLDVVLLEGGGLQSDPLTQQLYRGVNLGLAHDPPEESRSRFLGGSTNCWGGWCHPLDELDFQERPWVPHSGWPFGKDDLEPFYRRSQAWLGLPDAPYVAEAWAEAIAARGCKLLDLDGSALANMLDQISPPVRFGAEYRSRLEAASGPRVLLYANAAEILAAPDARQVEGIAVRTLNGKAFSISAKAVVLSAGGIENPRLLLASNSVQPEGLGNGTGLVGRYFMDHPRVCSARLTLRDANKYRPLYDASLHRLHRRRSEHNIEVHLAPSPATQERLGLPNSRTYFVARNANDMSKSFFALKAIQRAIRGRRIFGYPMRRAAQDVLRQVPALVGNAWNTAETVAELTLNSLKTTSEVSLESVIEPVPNPDSRVTLSQERDALGIPIVEIDWQLTAQDRAHLAALRELMTDELVRLGVAAKVEDPPGDEDQPENIMGCWHHMGTTRMHADPAHGVVDADCRVHGISNLYVAGSSVFPTAGSDSPTITLVALAIRLAEHIEAGLRQPVTARMPTAPSPVAAHQGPI